MLPISLAASLLCSPADRAASITHESGVPRIAVIDSGIARTPELGPLLEAEYDLATVPARPSFAPRATTAAITPAISTLRAQAIRWRCWSARPTDAGRCGSIATAPIGRSRAIATPGSAGSTCRRPPLTADPPAAPARRSRHRAKARGLPGSPVRRREAYQ